MLEGRVLVAEAYVNVHESVAFVDEPWMQS